LCSTKCAQCDWRTGQMEQLHAEIAAMREQLTAMAAGQASLSQSVDEVHRLLAPKRPQAAIERTSSDSHAGPVSTDRAVCVSDRLSTDLASVSEAASEGPVHRKLKQKPKMGRRKSFGGLPGDEVKNMLRDVFLHAEAEDNRKQEARATRPRRVVADFVKRSVREQLDTTVDTLMGVVILVNAVFIAFSMDMGDSSWQWLVADAFFSALFLLELGFKFVRMGIREYFCGPSRHMHAFDSSLVFLDLLQLMLVLAGGSEKAAEGMPSASLFRLIRLLKLARILRPLRSEVFSDLLAMVQGMVGGMTTLLWSVVFFVLFVYLVSLVFRETFGRKHGATASKFFNSVPRSMLTTFRCSFGDCTSSAGTPIFEHINSEYGALASIACCLFAFVITIGLFNVISAIFVQSTMLAAEALERQKKRHRLGDKALWSTRICTLIRRMMDISPEHTVPDRMSDAISEVFSVDVPGHIINAVSKDPEAIAALNDLEISPEDYDFLSDILDPDLSGSISLEEFVDGLHRLRGDPRRSDIVAVDLMVRSVQRQVAQISAGMGRLSVIEERINEFGNSMGFNC